MPGPSTSATRMPGAKPPARPGTRPWCRSRWSKRTNWRTSAACRWSAPTSSRTRSWPPAWCCGSWTRSAPNSTTCACVSATWKIPTNSIARTSCEPDVLILILVEEWAASGMPNGSWPLVNDAVQSLLSERLKQAYQKANQTLIEKGRHADDRSQGPGQARRRRPRGAPKAFSAPARSDCRRTVVTRAVPSAWIRVRAGSGRMPIRPGAGRLRPRVAACAAPIRHGIRAARIAAARPSTTPDRVLRRVSHPPAGRCPIRGPARASTRAPDAAGCTLARSPAAATWAVVAMPMTKPG